MRYKKLVHKLSKNFCNENLVYTLVKNSLKSADSAVLFLFTLKNRLLPEFSKCVKLCCVVGNLDSLLY